MRTVIFANGEFSPPDDLDALLDAADLLIAADGGTRHILALGRMPDLVIGDLDSLPAEEREDLESLKVTIKVFPVDKEQTDLELALLAAKEGGADEIVVLAGLGRRWDHSLANLLLAALPDFADTQVNFLHGAQQLVLIREKAEVQAEIGSRLSLIPIGGDVRDVRTQGLAFPLDGETLKFGSSRGISNVFSQEKASIDLESGLLLCVMSPADYD